MRYQLFSQLLLVALLISAIWAVTRWKNQPSPEISSVKRQMLWIDQLHKEFIAADQLAWRGDQLGARATLLREAFTELIRDPASGQRSGRYVSLLQESETLALDLELQLQRTERSVSRLSQQWKELQERCIQCHRDYRRDK